MRSSRLFSILFLLIVSGVLSIMAGQQEGWAQLSETPQETPTLPPQVETPFETPTEIPPIPVETPTVIPPIETPTIVPPVETPTQIPPIETPTVIPPVETPTSIPPVETPTRVPPVETPTPIPPVETPTESPTPIPPVETPTESPTPKPPVETPTETPVETLRLSIQDATVGVNGQVSILLGIENAKEIDAFAFDVIQSNNILRFDSISQEGTLTEDLLFINARRLEEPGGAIRIAGIGGEESVSGDGLFLRLNYTAQAVGLTTLSIENLIDDVEGAEIVAGVVTVKLQPVPTETPVETPTVIPTESPTPAPRAIVSIVARSGQVGDEIVAYMLVQNTGRLKSFGFDVLQTNNLLQFEQVDTQATILTGVRNVNARPLVTPTGAIRVQVDSRAARIPRKGLLLRIRYTAITAGETFLRLTNLTGDLANARISNIGGFVSIGERGVLGDVDLDGQVTGSDVFFLLSYLAGLEQLTAEQLQLADCNQDGAVNIRDVQCIFNLSVGLPAEGRMGKVSRTAADGVQLLSANSISVQDESIDAGDTASIDISITGASDIQTFSFDLVFDTNLLQFVAVNNEGTLTNDFIVLGNEASAGRVTIIGTRGTSSPISGDGIFLRLDLRAKANASGQATASIENLTADLEGVTAQGGTITIIPSAGEATPTPIQPTPTPAEPVGDFTVSPSEISLSAGSSEMIDIFVTGVSEPVTAYTFDFVYDTEMLEFISISKTGTLSSAAQVVGNEVETGRVRITGLPSLTQPITQDGIVLRIEMRAKADVEGSSLVGTENLQAGFKSALPGVGIVIVVSGVPGDLNGDGIIDANDLFSLSRWWKTAATDESGRSDLNKDEVIDLYDLLNLVEDMNSND